MQVPDEVRKCVAFICLKSGDEMKLKGTAFFLSLPVEGSASARFIYVVTAKHVIEGIRQNGTDGSVYIRLNFKDSADYVPIPIDQWVSHPCDGTVDASVLAWGPPTDIIDYTVIPADKMTATEEVIKAEDIGCGDEVFLTGLFVNHYGKYKNQPIVRTGNIALMPEEPVATRALGAIDAYLVEARSIGGLSGSPVFVHPGIFRAGKGEARLRGNTFYWLGLMHGHWDLPTDASVSLDTLDKERVNMGIAIVVPSTKILEVINQERFVLDRQRKSKEWLGKMTSTPDLQVENGEEEEEEEF